MGKGKALRVEYGVVIEREPWAFPDVAFRTCHLRDSLRLGQWTFAVRVLDQHVKISTGTWQALVESVHVPPNHILMTMVERYGVVRLFEWATKAYAKSRVPRVRHKIRHLVGVCFLATKYLQQWDPKLRLCKAWTLPIHRTDPFWLLFDRASIGGVLECHVPDKIRTPELFEGVWGDSLEEQTWADDVREYLGKFLRVEVDDRLRRRCRTPKERIWLESLAFPLM